MFNSKKKKETEADIKHLIVFMDQLTQYLDIIEKIQQEQTRVLRSIESLLDEGKK